MIKNVLKNVRFVPFLIICSFSILLHLGSELLFNFFSFNYLAERGDDAIRSIKENKAVYLVAVGGAAFLVSQAIKASKVIAFDDLGMEAIHEFEVKDMPVTVAVDSNGLSIHKEGIKQWAIINQ